MLTFDQLSLTTMSNGQGIYPAPLGPGMEWGRRGRCLTLLLARTRKRKGSDSEPATAVNDTA